MKKILFILLLPFIATAVHSQMPDALRQRLEGKTRLSDIMTEVEDFYKNDKDAGQLIDNKTKKEFENNYLRWKRWEYYQSSRLDENGNVIPNVSRKIYDGWKAYEENNALRDDNPESSYSSWFAYGPTSVVRYGAGYNSGYGRVNCIAFHPTLVNYLLIGTPQGGVWRSTNNGTSWLPLTDKLPSPSVGGLVWDRTNSNIIYVLTGDGDASGGGLVSSYGYNIPALGVFKSTDGGASWFLTGDFPGVVGSFHGYKLMQHPTSANTLFAATTDGIYKTTNGGTSWTLAQAGNFTDIEFKPGDPTIMYAAQRGGSAPFWRSTDSGNSWTNSGFTGVPTVSTRIAIGVSANQPNYIYMLVGGATGSGSFRGLYRSTTSGIPSFTLRSNTPNILGYPNDGSDDQDQAGYDHCIEVDPDNASVVITGGINIWRSADGGSTWGGSSRTQWSEPAAIDYVHADIHNLAYNPLNGNLYTTTDGGVGFSTNDGTDWTFISSNLQLLATYRADWYEADQNIIASGTQDNGTDIRYTASNTYRHIFGADGFDCVIKSDDANTIVMIANASIRKTTDGGLNVSNVSPTGVGFFPQLARDFNSNTRIYAGDASNIYRSTNFGTSWTTFSAGVSGRVLTTCPSNSDRLYTGSGTTLQRSDNATTTLSFTTISGTPGYPAGVNVTDIAVRPTNSLIAYASFGGYSAGNKVFSTTDGGANWTNFSGSLPNVACHSIAVDVNNVVYVGTDVGVFVRSTSMTDWQPFYNFLPRTPVSTLMANNTTGRIIATTFGRGNFYADFYSTCPLTLNVTGNYSGTNFFEASSTVTSTATVTQGAGSNMALKSGGFVNLNPGFEIKDGSEMRSYIAPCNTGGIPLRVQSMDEVVAIDAMFVPAKNGVRYSDGIITRIFPGKNGADLNIITEGSYSARIVNEQGAIVRNIFTDQLKKKGTGTVIFSTSGLPSGLYYIQLFKENELVHFHEFDVR